MNLYTVVELKSISTILFTFGQAFVRIILFLLHFLLYFLSGQEKNVSIDNEPSTSESKHMEVVVQYLVTFWKKDKVILKMVF